MDEFDNLKTLVPMGRCLRFNRITQSQYLSTPLKKQGGPIVNRAAEAFHYINTNFSRGTVTYWNLIKLFFQRFATIFLA